MVSSPRFRGVLSLFTLLFCFLLWYGVAADYSDGVASGRYRLAQDGETSTLLLNPDHTFQISMIRLGKEQHAAGTWRQVGEGGIAFSKEFSILPGQETRPDGSAFADMHKDFGLFVSLALRQYQVVWYGKVDSSSKDGVSGTYAGDENGIPATLILKADHTFEQSVTYLGVRKQAQGKWILGQNGNISFSKEFLKTSGEPLSDNETASAMDPQGSNLQVEIAVVSKSGPPTFRKSFFR
jgi:hypothetical protein